MQNFSQLPIFCDVADWFAYPALTAGNSRSISIATANSSNKGYITLQSDHYFLFAGFSAQTNYDNASPVLASANASAVIPIPRTPNAFTVEISRASSNNYANVTLTQAEVCSGGMYSGKQNPFPVIYGASQTIAFKFTDLTGLFLLTEAGAQIPLAIQFWILGYTIPFKTWDRFLGCFPPWQREYMQPTPYQPRSSFRPV
jgi:hypothetical protein